MSETLYWLALGVTLMPVWGALLYVIWQGWLRVFFVPEARIEAMVDALIARYGASADEIAAIHEDRAWRSAQTYEQAIWHRVRRALRCRVAEPEA